MSGMAIQCGYCSPTQMRQAAASRGAGEHYVADVPGGVFRRFAVSCGSEQPSGGGEVPGMDSPSQSAPGGLDPVASPSGREEIVSGCTGAGIVTAVEVDPAALKQFTIVRQAWIETAGTFAKALDYPYVNTGMFWNPPPGPLGGPNAYNVLSDANFRGMLGDALASNSPAYIADIEVPRNHVAAMIKAYAGRSGGLRVRVSVVFPDESSAVYAYRYDDASAEYLAGSARTPGGQAIPDPELANSSSSTGSWSEVGPYGGQEDLQRFLEYMRSRGVQIVAGDDAGRIRGVTCSWGGEALSCAAR